MKTLNKYACNNPDCRINFWMLHNPKQCPRCFNTEIVMIDQAATDVPSALAAKNDIDMDTFLFDVYEFLKESDDGKAEDRA